MTPVGGAGSRSDSTREAIMSAAVARFHVQGIDTTAAEEVAQDAHVSVGTVYHHFGSKEGLAVAYVDRALDALESDLNRVPVGGDPVARIFAAGRVYFAFALRWPAVIQYGTIRSMQVRSSGPDAPTRGLQERTQKLILATASDAREAMDQGLVPRQPLDELMVTLWGAYSGITQMVVRRDLRAIPPALARRSLAYAEETLKIAWGLQPVGKSSGDEGRQPIKSGTADVQGP